MLVTSGKGCFRCLCAPGRSFPSPPPTHRLFCTAPPPSNDMSHTPPAARAASATSVPRTPTNNLPTLHPLPHTSPAARAASAASVPPCRSCPARQPTTFLPCIPFLISHLLQGLLQPLLCPRARTAAELAFRGHEVRVALALACNRPTSARVLHMQQVWAGCEDVWEGCDPLHSSKTRAASHPAPPP